MSGQPMVNAFIWNDETKRAINVKFETAGLPNGMEVQGSFSLLVGDGPLPSREELEQMVQQLSQQMPMLRMMMSMNMGMETGFNITVGNPDATGDDAEAWLRKQ